MRKDEEDVESGGLTLRDEPEERTKDEDGGVADDGKSLPTFRSVSWLSSPWLENSSELSALQVDPT
jgi:hypothetical protein